MHKIIQLGGKGTEIAGALLEKGIHVIQEHPVHYNDIVKLLKVAKENNCVYQVSDTYKKDVRARYSKLLWDGDV